VSVCCAQLHCRTWHLTQQLRAAPHMQRDKPLGSEPWFNPEAVTEQKVLMGHSLQQPPLLPDCLTTGVVCVRAEGVDRAAGRAGGVLA
jgi:hypothetical protein